MKDKNNHIDDQLKESFSGFEQMPPDALWGAINPTSDGVSAVPKPHALLVKWAAIFLIATGISYTIYHYFSKADLKKTAVSDKQNKNQITDSFTQNNLDLMFSKDQMVLNNIALNKSQDKQPHIPNKVTSSPTTNKNIARDVADISARILENTNLSDEFPSIVNEHNLNERVDKSNFETPIVLNLVPKPISSFMNSLGKLDDLGVPSIKQITPILKTTKPRNKKLYVQFSLQKLALETVDYKTKPQKDKTSKLSYTYEYQEHIVYNKVLLVGAKLNNGLILETGATRGNYNFTNLYKGEFYAKDKEESLGKHNYNINVETTNGAVDAKVKLTPDPSGADPKKKFITSIYMNQELESWGIPLRVGYMKSRNKWGFIAKVGLDLTFFKQSDLNFEIVNLSDNSYMLSTAIIDIENVVPSIYKMTYGLQGQLGVEYRPIPRLGLQGTIGASNELHKSTIGIPNRRWTQSSIGLKWYL